jgi:hypothetical protein
MTCDYCFADVRNCDVAFRIKEYELNANGLVEPGEPKPLFRRRLASR